jgi:hypothetical protein
MACGRRAKDLHFLWTIWYAFKKLIDRSGQGRDSCEIALSALVRIVKSDRISHFFATKNRFNLTFAPRLLTDTGSRCKGKNRQYGHERK